jgi:pimeloyl-ACP methyl ester carboxylesterase
MAMVECSGGGLFYEARGAGEPLVLIPGTGGHTGTLAVVAERLAASHRTIVYDRRGHTQSTAPVVRKQYLAQHIEDAACLLRGVDASPATLFGWSWGGLVALGVAIEHPTLVRQLVLYEPPLHAKKHMSFAVLRGVGGAILRGKLGMHRRGAIHFGRFALGRNDGTNGFDDLTPDMRESLLANAKTIIAELEAGTGEELTTEQVSSIRCPVAIIVGGRSRGFLHEAAKRLHALLPASQWIDVAEGDHLMNVLRPDAMVDAIRRAIAS